MMNTCSTRVAMLVAAAGLCLSTAAMGQQSQSERDRRDREWQPRRDQQDWRQRSEDDQDDPRWQGRPTQRQQGQGQPAWQRQPQSDMDTWPGRWDQHPGQANQQRQQQRRMGTWDQSDDWRQQQQQQGGFDQQDQRFSGPVVHGTIDSIRTATLRGERHVIVFLETDRGFQQIDLGPLNQVRQVANMLNEGSPLVVSGRTSNVGGRQVILADRVQVDGRWQQAGYSQQTQRSFGTTEWQQQQFDQDQTWNQRQQFTQSSTSGQSQWFTGTVDSINTINIQNNQHLLVALDTSQGLQHVDLGPVSELRELRSVIREGKTLLVSGSHDQLQGRQVIKAETISFPTGYAQMGRQTGQQQFTQQWEQRQQVFGTMEEGGMQSLQGTIQSVNVTNIQNQQHLVVNVRTQEGVQQINLGPANQVQHVRSQLQEGQRVSVSGSKTTLDGQQMVIAQNMNVNGQNVQINNQFVQQFQQGGQQWQQDQRRDDRFEQRWEQRDEQRWEQQQRWEERDQQRWEQRDQQRWDQRSDQQPWQQDPMASQQMGGQRFQGTIQSVNVTNIQNQQHLVVHLRTQQGTQQISLGPVNQVQHLRSQLQQGQQLTVTGSRSNLDGQQIVVAQNLNLDGQNIQISSQQQTGQQQFGQQQQQYGQQMTGSQHLQGTIQSVSTTTIQNKQHLVVHLKTQEGVQQVTLGPADQVQHLRAQLREGQQLTVSGSKTSLEGKQLVIAQSAQIDGQQLQINQDFAQQQGRILAAPEEEDDPADLKTLSGTIQSVSTISLDNKQVTVLNLNTAQGPMRVLLGEPDDVAHLRNLLREGSQCSIQGKETDKQGQKFFKAKSITIDGQTHQIKHKDKDKDKEKDKMNPGQGRGQDQGQGQGRGGQNR